MQKNGPNSPSLGFCLLVVLLALLALTYAARLPADRLVAAQPAEGLPLLDWTRWGPFVAPGNFDMNRCRTLQSGDVNSDGRADLICPYDYGGGQMRTFVQYSLGDSFTGWTAMHSQFLNFDLTRCHTLLSGDVDPDGRTDLICPISHNTGTNDTYVQVAEGNSYSPWILHQGGVFNLDSCRPLVAGRNSIFFLTGLICVRDLGNSSTRTLVQYSNGALISQWLNGSPLSPPGSFNVNNCRHVRVADVNGDGRDDLLCPYDYGNASTTTFAQLGTGNYEFTGWGQWGIPLPAGAFDMKRCQAVLVGDANGDGLDDLFCPYNYGGNQTRTFIQYSEGGNGTGWIAMHGQLQNAFNVASCRTLQAGDINGDGRTDLFCPYDYGNGATTTFVQLSGVSGYTFWQQASSAIAAGNFDLGRCRPLVAGDVNGDGRIDLICPYDYGNASTATFVQLSRNYRIALPAVLR